MDFHGLFLPQGVCEGKGITVSLPETFFNCSTSDTPLKNWIIQRALIAAPRYPSLPSHRTILSRNCSFPTAFPRDTGSTHTQRSSCTYSQQHDTLGRRGFLRTSMHKSVHAHINFAGWKEEEEIINPLALTKSKQIDWSESLICIGLIEDVICCWINVVASKSNL